MARARNRSTFASIGLIITGDGDLWNYDKLHIVLLMVSLLKYEVVASNSLYNNSFMIKRLGLHIKCSEMSLGSPFLPK